MLFRRLIWWMNGRSLDEAVAELRSETAKMQGMSAESVRRRELWEGEQLPNGWANHSSGRPLTVSLNDDLTNWLWQAAFSGCHLTGDWDLLNACAGIAHAIRTEGIPLSAGLRAAAAPARSGGTDVGSE